MNINYQKMGTGDPLIVIHGLFGTSDNLKGVAKELASDFTVYLIDAPAHGDSDTIKDLTIERMASGVISFLESMQLTSVAILGHSLGGKIAMEMALLRPELISKLVVADIAPVQYTRRHDDIIRGLKSVPLDSLTSRKQADSILSDFIPEIGVRGFLLKSLIKKPETENQWMWRFDLDTLALRYDEIIKANRTGTYDKPTLFIIGSASNYVKPEYRPQIVSRFPNVQAKTIAGAGHWLHAERPVAFIKITRDFLNQ